METEIPAMLRAREAVAPERFTFHSSRMRMKKVTREELAAMDDESDHCALAAIQQVENSIGLPVVSAATCTTLQMLKALGLATIVPNAGCLLSGQHT